MAATIKESHNWVTDFPSNERVRKDLVLENIVSVSYRYGNEDAVFYYRKVSEIINDVSDDLSQYHESTDKAKENRNVRLRKLSRTDDEINKINQLFFDKEYTLAHYIADAITARPPSSVIYGTPRSVAEQVQALNEYDYQSCEHDEFDVSRVKKWVSYSYEDLAKRLANVVIEKLGR